VLYVKFSSATSATGKIMPIYWCGEHSGNSVVIPVVPAQSNVANILLVLPTVCSTLPVYWDIACLLMLLLQETEIWVFKIASKLKKKRKSITTL
jgi:hypothetical protein